MAAGLDVLVSLEVMLFTNNQDLGILIIGWTANLLIFKELKFKLNPDDPNAASDITAL